MKKNMILIFSLILNVILIFNFIYLFNFKITWEHNGKIYSHKCGNFMLEYLRGEWTWY